MTKHRLEMFSDGVFAIVLTILVLDLHVPSAHGLAGLWEVTPALLVHAATFFTVGAFWLMHHGGLARVTEINTRTLLINFLALFWVTLLPFAARNAAERPLEPLGASMIAGCSGFYFVSALVMRLNAHSTIDDNPNMRAWRRRRIVIGCAISLADIVCAGLAWVSPWIGYGATLGTVALILLLPSPPEAERVFERQGA